MGITRCQECNRPLQAWEVGAWRTCQECWDVFLLELCRDSVSGAELYFGADPAPSENRP